MCLRDPRPIRHLGHCLPARLPALHVLHVLHVQSTCLPPLPVGLPVAGGCTLYRKKIVIVF